MPETGENAQTIVIVGAGQTGGRAAEAVRQAGFAGRVVLIGDEPQPPYERPPLSKEMLGGDMPPEKSFLNPADYYASQSIEWWPETRAEKIDAKTKHLILSGAHAGELAYDALLLATGARVRHLPANGADLPGIHYIRTIADTLALKPKLVDGAKIVVIGGGFIGLEAAASARSRGCDVTVLEMQQTLLGRVCDKWVGDWYVDLHRKHGVTVRTAVVIDAVVGDGKAEGVRLSDGTIVAADAIVVGIGIIPNVELAEAAGLAVENGIVADEFGRTSDPAIFAAGDVANIPSPITGHRVRLESWGNAQNGGIAVGRNMAAMLAGGALEPYDDVPWFWSDQYDVNLQIAGVPRAWDKVVTRGDAASGKFMLFYMRDGRVVAANTFNLGRDMRFARKLIQSGKSVAESDLADETAKLKDLAG